MKMNLLQEMLWLIQLAKLPLQLCCQCPESGIWVQMDGTSVKAGQRRAERGLDAEKLLVGGKKCVFSYPEIFHQFLPFCSFYH